MKKTILMTIISIIVLAGGGVFYLYNAEITPISHHWEGYKSWYKSSGTSPITGDDTHFLGGKHQGNEGYRVIYVNAKGADINMGKPPYVYPEGTVIVKEQYKNKSSFESGKNQI